MLTALRVLEVVCRSGRTLDDLVADLIIYPQILVNVRVKQRRPLAELVSVQERIREAETSFAGDGRVLVRFSGTEPLVRVMVEGADLESVHLWAGRIADELRTSLGVRA
jgi:phosphoglucosamine mutase